MEPSLGQRAALSQLAAVPGVVGSMVFDQAGAVAFSEFPPVFDTAGLEALAGTLSADGYFQEWLAGDHASLDLQFGDGRVILRSLEQAWLLVLCTPQVNAPLLSMSLTQVLRRLRLGAEPARATTGEFALAAAPPARPPEPSLQERLQALVTAELGEQGAQAHELLAAAGNAPGALLGAVADVEKLTRLFISKKKAEELGRHMRELLERAK